MFKIARCKGKGAFSAKLNKPRRLDFSKLKSKFDVIVDTPHVMVLKVDGIEVIVHRHSDLLFKNCKDEKKMDEIAKEIFENA